MAPIQYQYSKLESPNHIRLIYLSSGDPHEPLYCTIQHANLKDAPQYHALSYVWGDSRKPKRLQIGGNHYLDITLSLFHALRDVRATRAERMCYAVWADGVCINQADLDERAQQVSMMSSIYRQSTHIITYIGPEADNSKLGLDFAHELCSWEHRRRDSITLDPRLQMSPKWTELGLPAPENPKWEALQSVLKRPWPGRAWIVQESLLGIDPPIMVCGRSSVHWMVLCQTVALARMGRLPAALSPRGGEDLAARCLVNLGGLRQGIWSEKRELAIPLLTLLEICHDHQCSDPRDKIFSLLGVASDRDALGIEVNYRTTISDLYTETATRIVEQYQSLDILSAIGSEKNFDLPSWVPDWTKKPRAESFVKPTLPTPRGLNVINSVNNVYKYQTGGNGKTSIKINRVLKTLTVDKAVIFDEITYISQKLDVVPMLEGRGMSEWLRMNLKHCVRLGSYPAPETLEDAFWMTLIAGKTHESTEAESQFRREFKAFFDAASDGFTGVRKWVPSDYLGTSLTEGFGTASAAYSRHQLVGNFGIALLGGADQRAFCTSAGGSMGLAPAQTMEGDVICVIPGARVPYVLREDGGNYKLVGECYVHGIMKGEALDLPRFESDLREVSLT
ncbi:uncharacterized protein K441DRAFT_652727 [Cenococcum geophilum 1.58]|uniref:uncharacterized protein n=1 Tax=Cenococcum geophilum 1.58 TaxID=794803 RepID=UPI003590060E|nr:hypothetical protein K441DRAFT_652727 [Cenococcum geophilum 1.58]